MDIDVFSDVRSFFNKVTNENKFKLQTQILSEGLKKGLEVNVTINGKGCALTQFISRYNVKTAPKGSFNMTVSPTDRNDIKVCAAYTGSKEKTNMVVIEVELPSGYKLQEGIMDEVKSDMVKLIEYDEKSNSVALYFNEMPKTQICTELNLQEILQVEARQNPIAKIYDYYDLTDTASVEYP